jgi:hypothetical protein
LRITGVKFLTVRKGSCKYGKGKMKMNADVGLKLELEIKCKIMALNIYKC